MTAYMPKVESKKRKTSEMTKAPSERGSAAKTDTKGTKTRKLSDFFTKKTAK